MCFGSQRAWEPRLGLPRSLQSYKVNLSRSCMTPESRQTRSRDATTDSLHWDSSWPCYRTSTLAKSSVRSSETLSLRSGPVHNGRATQRKAPEAVSRKRTFMRRTGLIAKSNNLGCKKAFAISLPLATDLRN
jgi:hypothetical protein